MAARGSRGGGRNRVVADRLGRLAEYFWAGLEMSDSPHSVEAEQSVLGALLVDDSGFAAVAAAIEAADFFSAHTAEVWRAMAALHGRGRPIDLPLIVEELRSRGTLDTV